MATIRTDRPVVFGNNRNDLPMFDIADESYAVADSVPEALGAATGIVGSNDEDAVALWMDANSAERKRGLELFHRFACHQRYAAAALAGLESRLPAPASRITSRRSPRPIDV